MSSIVPYSELQSMALSVTKSGMFGLKNENQAITLMLIAQAENIHPIQAIQMYSVINGMPALKTTEMIARYMRSGGKIVWLETTDKIAKAKFIFEENELVYEYTIQDATKAQLTGKDNWKRMPKEMLRARCASSGIRMSNPASLNNMYSVEEAMDIPSANDMPTIEVEDAEIVEQKPTQNALKLMLANRLKELSFSSTDIKDFANKYVLNENEELLNDLVNDRDLLLDYVNKFEGKNND
jgi:hypothetical protein